MTDEERRAGFGVDSVKVGVKRERRPADANLMQGWCGESEPVPSRWLMQGERAGKSAAPLANARPRQG